MQSTGRKPQTGKAGKARTNMVERSGDQANPTIQPSNLLPLLLLMQSELAGLRRGSSVYSGEGIVRIETGGA